MYIITMDKKKQYGFFLSIKFMLTTCEERRMLMNTKFSKVCSLMEKYGYNEFQQKFCNSITRGISDKLQMENTSDITTYTDPDMESITIFFKSTIESYTVDMRPRFIWVKKCTKDEKDSYLSIYLTEYGIDSGFIRLHKGFECAGTICCKDVKKALQHIIGIDVCSLID